MILVILAILLIWCAISWFIDINYDYDGLFGVFLGVIPLIIGAVVAGSLAV